MRDYIDNIIKEAQEGVIDKEVIEYKNYDSKYVILKPKVFVTVELPSGIVLKVDVTKYFKDSLKGDKK